MSDVVMDLHFHGEDFLLPDDLRHPLHQLPHPLIGVLQPLVFRCQRILLMYQFGHIRRRYLGVTAAIFCLYDLLRKPQDRAIREPIGGRPGVQLGHGIWWGSKCLLQFRKGLNTAAQQLGADPEHPPVHQTGNSSAVEKAERHGKIVKALLDDVHPPAPPSSVQL